jgi:phosphate transport system permease protein
MGYSNQNLQSIKPSKGSYFPLIKGVSLFLMFVFVAFILFVIIKGVAAFDWNLLLVDTRNSDQRFNFISALLGTCYLLIVSFIISVPVGLLGGFYYSGFFSNNKYLSYLKMLNRILSGVPSIIFGMFGMVIFVNRLGFGYSILAGSITLSLIAIPHVIKSTEEAIRSVDKTYIESSMALGASKIHTAIHVILPIAFPKILSGFFFTMARISGETAPLILTTATYMVTQLPASVFEPVVAIPHHVFLLARNGVENVQTLDLLYALSLVLLVIAVVVNIIVVVFKWRELNKK